MNRDADRSSMNLDAQVGVRGGVERLLSVLAWADCREASLLVAAGDIKSAAARLADATAKFEAVARYGRRHRRTFWRPMVVWPQTR